MICPGRVRTNISMNALGPDGNKHALLDKGQAEGITAKKAAKKIVNAIYKQKSELFVGGKELIMVTIKRFLPGLSRILVRKIKPN
jgi:short-subunit dehydrogenase